MPNSSRDHDETNPLALERQLCFALAVTNRAVLGIYRPLLEPLNLTHPQYLVMLALWEESPRTVKNIGEAIQLDSATLSPLLKRLESAGHVTRAKDPSDERTTLVDLTTAGLRLRDGALDIPAAVIDALGVEIAVLENLRSVLTTVNQSATGLTGDRSPRGRP